MQSPLLLDFALGVVSMGWMEKSVLVLVSVGPESSGTRDGGGSGQNKRGDERCPNTETSPEIARSRIALAHPPRASMSQHMWSCAPTFACWRRSHGLVARSNFRSPYKDMSSST